MHETELIGLVLRWPLKIKNKKQKKQKTKNKKAIVCVCVEFCEDISFTSCACDQAVEAW